MHTSHSSTLEGPIPTELHAASEALLHQERPIPWAMIGVLTTVQARCVQRLVEEVDPRGVILLTTSSGDAIGPASLVPLRKEQILTILRRTRYWVWYQEDEASFDRRTQLYLSYLSGSVPLTIVHQLPKTMLNTPFAYLCLDEPHWVEQMRNLDFHSIQKRFMTEASTWPDLN